MFERSFRRRAVKHSELAGALGSTLQKLREEGYVAASVERVRQHAGAGSADAASELWSTESIVDTGLVSLTSSANRPLVLDEGLLYFAADWRLEVDLATNIAALANAPPMKRKHTSGVHEGLGENQRDALRHALCHQLTVVSGGPGTGKTTLVGHLIRSWLADGGDPSRLLIAAPTGRAAARLSAAVASSVEHSLPPATTLHRALRWSPSQVRFQFDKNRPLDAQLVIVDEVSMADLGLMQALFSALASDAQVVLLGDKDQLVSVQPGSVMADLCMGLATSGASHCVQTLAENFRYSAQSGIARAASAIRRGESAELFDVLAQGDDVEQRALLTGLDTICADWLDFDHAVETIAIWGQLLSKRVLCAHRSGPAGVNRLNAMIFRWLRRNGHLDGRYVDHQQPFPGRLFSLQGNHYEAGFFNGDQGFISQQGGQLMAWVESSDRTLKSLSPARLPPVESAFAMTVHRAQGSEFGEVHCVLPDRSSPLLTRELLYTAITRARQRVVIYADQSALEKAVATPASRGSGLATRLRKMC